MKRNFNLLAVFTIGGLLIQANVFASCYSRFSGVYADNYVQLRISASTASGKTAKGFFSYNGLKIKFIPMANVVRQVVFRSGAYAVSDVKVVLGNIIYDLNPGDSFSEGLSINLYRFKNQYKIQLHYQIPNKDKNAPVWKKMLRIRKNLLVKLDQPLKHCHQTGSLIIKEIN